MKCVIFSTNLMFYVLQSDDWDDNDRDDDSKQDADAIEFSESGSKFEADNHINWLILDITGKEKPLKIKETVLKSKR